MEWQLTRRVIRRRRWKDENGKAAKLGGAAVAGNKWSCAGLCRARTVRARAPQSRVATDEIALACVEPAPCELEHREADGPGGGGDAEAAKAAMMARMQSGKGGKGGTAAKGRRQGGKGGKGKDGKSGSVKEDFSTGQLKRC